MEDQYFNFSTTIKNILFKNWNVESSLGLILTFLFFLFMATVLEAVAHLELLLTRHYQSNPLTWSWQSRRLKIHVARSVLHIPRVILGYLLMLAVMTYNTYMFIAIVIGSAIGYFIFSQLEHQRPSIQYSRQSFIVSNNAEEKTETEST